MSRKAVTLWLYGDVACPWSYLAFARIRRLADELPVVVGWRPLRSGGFSRSPDASEFAGLGVCFEDRPAAFDSTEALQAIEFSRDLGQAALDRTLAGLFAANFGGSANHGDRDELLDVCRGLGLDEEALGLSLEDGRYESELELVEEEAERYGIEQVPTILAGTMKIIGAAPMDVLASAVNRILDADRN